MFSSGLHQPRIGPRSYDGKDRPAYGHSRGHSAQNDEDCPTSHLAETPIGEDGNSHLGDLIENHSEISPVDAIINVDLQRRTAQVLHSLTAREEKVVRMRFGLEDGSEHTLEEIGKRFAVSRERISTD